MILDNRTKTTYLVQKIQDRTDPISICFVGNFKNYRALGGKDHYSLLRFTKLSALCASEKPSKSASDGNKIRASFNRRKLPFIILQV